MSKGDLDGIAQGCLYEVHIGNACIYGIRKRTHGFEMDMSSRCEQRISIRASLEQLNMRGHKIDMPHSKYIYPCLPLLLCCRERSTAYLFKTCLSANLYSCVRKLTCSCVTSNFPFSNLGMLSWEEAHGVLRNPGLAWRGGQYSDKTYHVRTHSFRGLLHASANGDKSKMKIRIKN